jgi:hypothetical protein
MSTLTSLVKSGKRKLAKKNVGRTGMGARGASAATELRRVASDDGSIGNGDQAESRASSHTGRKEAQQN